MKQTPDSITKQKGNEVPLDQLPVEVKAYRDENGFAILIKSKEKRIGNAEGKLVDTFLVRILGGEVPKAHGAHAVAVSEEQAKHVEVADSKIDERGRLFITSATDGIQRPAAKQ